MAGFIKPIIARTPNLSGLENVIKTVMEEHAEVVKVHEEDTTLDFNTVFPDFIILGPEKEGEGFRARIGPRLDDDGKIWAWLNNGTDVRYALMSDDFVAKTTPGTLSTGPGAGSLLTVDPSNPQPGIDAREWTLLIVELVQPVYEKDMAEAIKRKTRFR